MNTVFKCMVYLIFFRQEYVLNNIPVTTFYLVQSLVLRKLQKSYYLPITQIIKLNYIIVTEICG
jgi:hypothetical protein